MNKIFTKFIFFYLIYCPLFIFSDDLPLSYKDGGSVSIVNGCVSAITGDYCEVSRDLEIKGPESLTLDRSFCSSDKEGGTFYGWTHNHESKITGSDSNKILSIFYTNKDGRTVSYIGNLANNDKTVLKYTKYLNKSFTNFGSGSFSGRTHIKNSKVYNNKNAHFLTVKSENGSSLDFKEVEHSLSGRRYTVRNETLANGNYFKYDYNKDDLKSLKSIQAFDSSRKHKYSEINFNFLEKKELKQKLVHIVDSSDGRQIVYNLQEFPKINDDKSTPFRYRLKNVYRPNAPYQKYEYAYRGSDRLIQLCKKEAPDGHFLAIEYYGKENKYAKDRVSKLFAPVGFDGQSVLTHQFVYAKQVDRKGEFLKGVTYAFDAKNQLTAYWHGADHRISEIKKYRDKANHRLYSNEQFHWSEHGNLLFHLIEDQNNCIQAAKAYVYDSHNNVIQDTFFGNLQGYDSTISFNPTKKKLTGNDSLTTSYEYNDENLLIEEQCSNGKTVKYAYDKDRDLLISKLTLENGMIKIREFYEYDSFALVTKIIKDDGSSHKKKDLSQVTFRQITKTVNQQVHPIGLPIQIEEYHLDVATGNEVLFKKVKNHYSNLGHLTTREIYDAHDVLRYTERFEYDAHGLVTLEENALGQKTIKWCNNNDEQVYEKSLDNGYHKEFVYDFSGRLIAEKECHDDGTLLVTANEYNHLNQLVAKIDAYGQRTEYEYDEFGRQVKIYFPTYTDPLGNSTASTIVKEYDLFGNVTSITDQLGRTTKTKLNVRGQPLQVTFADGATESKEYLTEGFLRKTIGKNGLVTYTTHDCFGRLTATECHSKDGQFLTRTTSAYNSFHKISDTDAKGTLTEYSYTISGLLKSVKKGNQLTEYGYDEFQRLISTKQWVSKTSFLLKTQKLDLLGRVIEERTEDENQTCHSLEQYTYDAVGNKTEIRQQKPDGVSVTKTWFDSQNRPIKTTDPLGNVTHISYNPIYHNGQKVLEIETLDPLGITSVIRMNIFGKPECITKKNSYGVLIAKKEIGYDAVLNVLFTKEAVISSGVTLREVFTKWVYNEQNNLISLIEAAGSDEQKITDFVYNTFGEKVKIIKPDGNVIEHSYDDFGRLQTFKDNDNSFSYEYTYDLNGNLIKSTDHINHQATSREYNPADNMIREVLGTGFEIGYAYDFIGRPVQVTLEDGSNICYEYNPQHLSKVTKFTKDGLEQYSHSYKQYDFAGNLLEEEKPLNLGNCDYLYNLNGNLTSIDFSQFSEKINYDACNNVTSYEITNTPQNLFSEFSYNDLYQLKSENGTKNHTYEYDSLHNCVEKDGKPQEVNSLNQLLKTCDQTFKYDLNGNRKDDGIIQYQYDALDRLCSVKSNGNEFTYTYDSFNRRLSKTITNEQEKTFKTHYLYFGQNEVGSFDQDKKLKEFRALGTGKGAEIGASIAIEIENQTYIPLHDHNGNIISILDGSTGQTVESYRYSAFGEEKIFDATGIEIEESKIGNPWRFSSKRIDSETGFSNFGRRYYDCKTAKWLSPDPLGFEAGPNLYAYVNNNPLSHFDLYGLEGSGYGYSASVGAWKYNVPQYSGFQSYSGYQGYSNNNLKITYNDNFENSFKNKSRNVYYSQYSGDILPYSNLGFINGNGNQLKDCMENAEILSRFSGGLDIHCTYAATHGPFYDAWKSARGLLFGESTRPVRLLHEAWNEFFDHAPPGAHYLQTCHSNGAIILRNALIDFPAELRERIHVIAIAPGAYIDAKICASVRHYVSERDFVPLFDRKGRIACRDTTITLKPNKEAPIFDHSFLSPTYARVINDRVQDFLNEYGDMYKNVQ